MANPLHQPLLVLPIALGLLCVAAEIGRWLRKKLTIPLADGDHDDFKFILGGTLTLLGLIIGFTFSMAVSRYDLRKTYEEQEANAIGTALLRAELLPAADAAKIHALLVNYLHQRISNYESRDPREIHRIDLQTAQLQDQLWSAVSGPVTAQPNPVNALVLAGMNEVLNSQSYTQAAWWNRIPAEAWILLAVIAILCNVLIGYGAEGRSTLILLILPIAIAISVFLIADIDNPRIGVIRVHPQNLESLAGSLNAQ
jgi:uncharacterized membrane protein